MGGGAEVGSDSEFTGNVQTLVLVGRMGDGKSSTGNSILGRKAFKSMASVGTVTTACELHSTVLENGRTLNVIDTPGLFDFSKHGVIGKEIANSVKMAMGGIHAVLVVLSARTRFSLEAEAAIKSLRHIFGTKISDYMILVYTAGDDLEEDGVTLEEYLSRDCPEPLKETLLMCENRCILFDNRTKDECKKSKQLDQLCCLVDKVVLNNDGKPYTNELFLEMQNETMKRDHEEQLKKYEEMIESKLRETAHEFELKLLEEQVARLKAEAESKEAQNKSDEERRILREKLERAEKERDEAKDRPQGGCAIL